MTTGARTTSALCGDKKSLRGRLRAERRSLGGHAQTAAAQGLLGQLLTLEIFLSARRIAIYLPNDGEIGTEEIIRWCHARGRQVYLPMVQRSEGRNWLLFGEYLEDTELVPNSLGIPEPVLPRSECVRADELDLVILPLVGFDTLGNRIGMGGGFYDTTFAFVREAGMDRPVLVGVAHEIQRVDVIDAQSWDIPLSTVVTDRKIYRMQS